MKIFTLLIAIIVFNIGCSETGSNEEDENQLFGNLYGSDTLTIEALIADCGEWGGHHERLDIFRRSLNKLMLHYQKDTVDCTNMGDFNRRIIEDWTKELSENDQIQIIDFIHSLTSMTLREKGNSNMSDYYFITKKSRGLSLSYSDNNQDWNGFKELKKKIAKTN